jgi:lysophospholipase L1-like esterase
MQAPNLWLRPAAGASANGRFFLIERRAALQPELAPESQRKGADAQMTFSTRLGIGLLAVALGLAAPPILQAGPAKSEFRLRDGNTIVFLGDSITQAATQPEGYISLFQLFCGVNGYEVKAINAGIGGHKSNDMLKRLQKDVLSHRPTWVSISCGVNDVWHGEKGVALPDYQRNMTEIVDRCLDAGAKVLLLTATPIYEDLDSPENKKLAAYNEFLRTLAREKKILLCDLNKAFADVLKEKQGDEKVLTTDGVHMAGRGNRLMAREILKSLGATRPQLRDAERRWELVNNL